MSNVFDTEVADAVADFELLVVDLDDVDELLVEVLDDAVVLCLVETLELLEVDFCEEVGVPAAPPIKATLAARRIVCNFMMRGDVDE